MANAGGLRLTCVSWLTYSTFSHIIASKPFDRHLNITPSCCRNKNRLRPKSFFFDRAPRAKSLMARLWSVLRIPYIISSRHRAPDAPTAMLSMPVRPTRYCGHEDSWLGVETSHRSIPWRPTLIRIPVPLDAPCVLLRIENVNPINFRSKVGVFWPATRYALHLTN